MSGLKYLLVSCCADEEDLHESAIVILFGLSFQSFAGEGNLPDREVGKCRFILVESFRNYLNSYVQIDAAEEMSDFGNRVVSRWGQHRF